MTIKRRTPLPRRTAPLARRGRPKAVNRKRKASEFARAYGSKERVAWVKLQGCVCGSLACFGAMHNAHTETGGMGRKAGYETIVPLCAYHHECYDNHLPPLDQPKFRTYIAECALGIAERWLSYCRANAHGETPK